MNDPFDLFMEYCTDIGKRDWFNRFPVTPQDNSLSETAQTVEDMIFEYLKTEKNEVSVAKFLAILRSTGLRKGDPRLQKMIQNFHKAHREQLSVESFDLLLNREIFTKCIHDNASLILRALKNQFIISDWLEFCQQVEQIYFWCRNRSDGKINAFDNASSKMSRAKRTNWGVAMCTVDGQRMSWGDCYVPWSLHSISKPLTYGIALHENGAEYVHNYVGHEPSGRLFNEICLDHNGKPHNPMITTGAIVVTSLIKGDWPLADRFDFVRKKYKEIAGGEFLGFSITTFQSELENPDKISSLAYYLKDNKCFPKDIDIKQTLDLYFQLCSIEVTCESAAVIAATLANGGVCPLTDTKVLSNQAVRDVLSLMYSCGMYDYSGQFAYQVGLPAKSGVSGGMILVIPNVIGLAFWSPPLDSSGNTVRGVEFCRKLVETFNFRNYDNLLHSDLHKIDPLKRLPESEEEQITNMLFAVAAGDLNSVKRYASRGFDMDATNYDGRTALQVAAAEGHDEIIYYLLHECRVLPDNQDRWKRTALDDAKLFGHNECVDMITSFERDTEISISHAARASSPVSSRLKTSWSVVRKGQSNVLPETTSPTASRFDASITTRREGSSE